MSSKKQDEKLIKEFVALLNSGAKKIGVRWGLSVSETAIKRCRLMAFDRDYYVDHDNPHEIYASEVFTKYMEVEK